MVGSARAGDRTDRLVLAVPRSEERRGLGQNIRASECSSGLERATLQEPCDSKPWPHVNDQADSPLDQPVAS